MKKKILYIITKSNWGGAQRYVFDLATSLPKEYFDIAVAHGGTGVLREKLSKENIRTIQIDGLQRDINLKDEIWSFFNLLRIIRREKPNIIHVNSSKAGIFGVIVGRLSGVPTIIFSVHGWAFNENRPVLARWIIRAIHLLTIILSHRTIVVSSGLREEISNKRYITSKIVVIKNGIDTKSILPSAQAREKIREIVAARKDYLGDREIDIRGKWIGTVAELHPNKGLGNAITAFSKIAKQFTNVFYVILGEGEQRDDLQACIRKLNLQNRVFLAGEVRDAYLFMSAFDIFVLPSLTESFGYVILEAGNASLPVIASSVGGIPEIISEETGILVEKGNSKMLEIAFKKLLQDKEYSNYLGKNLKTTVSTVFQKEYFLARTFGEYGLMPLVDPLPTQHAIHKVLLAIPARNEEKILRQNIVDIENYISKNIDKDRVQIDIFIADNASTDQTRFIAESLSTAYQNVKYCFTTQKGKGGAIKMAWNRSGYDLYMYTDADLEYDLKMIGAAIYAHFGGHQVIVASRNLNGSVTERTFIRNLLSRGYNCLIKMLFFNFFSDAQAGFKAVSPLIKDQIINLKEDGYFFDTSLLLTLENTGYEIHELPAICSIQRPSNLKVIKTILYFLEKLILLRIAWWLQGCRSNFNGRKSKAIDVESEQTKRL